MIVYHDYIRSAAWQRKSEQKKKLSRWKCFVCGNDYRKKGLHLTTHHLHYRTLGAEAMCDLVCLCAAHHPRGQYPMEYIRWWRTSYRTQKLAFRMLRLLTGIVLRGLRCTAKLAFGRIVNPKPTRKDPPS